jgi:FkbM family methyltransferase
MQLAMSVCRDLPARKEVTLRDGRRLSINIDNHMNEIIYFMGEYEKAVTEIATSLLRPGDICLDVGANFGWYTTLFRAGCCDTGSVHSFEPVPTTFAELERNVSLIEDSENIHINNVALGDHDAEVSIDLGDDTPSGFASISNRLPGGSGQIQCQMTTLDRYLEEQLRDREVNFVKVDIEGAELMFLKGAGRLFSQTVPPIMLVEMALEQTRNFDYTPNDLVRKLDELAKYHHYAVDDTAGTVRKITGFAEGDLGANVFSIPEGEYQDRIAELIKRTVN